MENYREKLILQLNEINELLAKSNRNLSKLQNIPKRLVKSSKSGGCVQYYWFDKTTNKKIYITKAHKEELRKTLQRDYEISVNKKLNALKRKLSKFLKSYNIDEIEKVYTNLPEARKILVTPIVETKEEFVKKWESVEYEPMEINDNIEFVSVNGVKVRSKSELIIANMLEQNGVCYRYEYPLMLNGLGTVRPDFLCLNKRTGKEYVWEHFGMMDNIAYANKNIAKIQTYEQNGFLAGKNMIMTFESSMTPLSSATIKQMIEEYLL
jgi:hypothetical protein